MSQCYGMYVKISGHDAQRADEIMAAAESEWPFGDWGEDEDALFALAVANLSGGEEEFADRLSRAIWRANGKFCEIQVGALYLEIPPRNDYCLDKDDYQRLMSPASGRELISRSATHQ